MCRVEADVPSPDFSIRARAEKCETVYFDRERIDGEMLQSLGVTFELMQLLAGCGVPNYNICVCAAGDEDGLVGQRGW